MKLLQQPLPIALRVVSLCIILLVVGERIFLGVWILPPLFVVVPTLILLSFLYRFWPRVVSGIVLVIAVLIPLAALLGFLAGKLVIVVPIVDTIIFGWLFWIAFQFFRNKTA